jgi:hypothetical protein
MPTRKGGMPRGHKTKKTLIKEEVQKMSIEMFQRDMVQKTEDVLNVIYERIVNDKDMTAAKIWMDRVMPTTKAVDSNNIQGDMIINVSVQKLEKPEAIEGELIQGEVNEDANGSSE